MGAISTLGGILPALATVNSTIQGFNSITGRNENSALDQLQARQQLQQQQLAEQNALDRERIALEGAQNEESRRAALRRAVARQRANFGVQGVQGSGGSSEAVLLGLFDETEDELRRREQLDGLRNRALDLNASQRSALNLLQATQLSERQNLDRLFTLPF